MSDFLAARRIELDGLRALAVLLVVAGHALLRLGFDPASAAVFTIVGNANLGVRIFFVLSGFLITSLLLEEKVNTGRISFRGFYLRRARRILPAFVAYLVVVTALAAAGLVQVSAQQLVAAATFTWNYLSTWGRDLPTGGSWYLGHLWTLSLEEQFYALWPLVVAFLSIRGQWRAAIGVIALWPVFRVASYFAFPESRGYINMFFHTGVDSIVWGSFFALVVRFKPAALLALCKRRDVAAAAALVLFVASPLLSARFHGAWALPIGFSLDAALSGVFIVCVMQQPLLQAAFSWAPLVRIGWASYSIYLWQQLFLAPSWAGGIQLPLLVSLPLLFAAGFASWRFIEGAFVKIGRTKKAAFA